MVLVVNQVMGGGAPDGSDSGNTVSRVQGVDDSLLSACLGNTWAHCVNTRIALEVLEDRRALKIVKSPLAPLTSFEYRVDASGIRVSGKSDAKDVRASEANVHSTIGK